LLGSAKANSEGLNGRTMPAISLNGQPVDTENRCQSAKDASEARRSRSFANWRKSRNAYRLSTGNPATGLMFHSGGGEPMDLDKLAQRIFRPAVEAIR